MSNDENTDLLLSLGLSLNQAKVYLAILKLEKPVAKQISKFSNVRREEVYRTLPSLEKMGLIERLMGKPMKIRDTPISAALNSIVSEEKIKFDARLKGMKNIVQKIAIQDWKLPPPENESLYILIAEKKSIMAKTALMIKNSKKEVALVADKTRILLVLAHFSDECNRAIKKGVQIRLIFEGENSDISFAQKVKLLINPASVYIKFHFDPLKHFIMSDAKEALITTSKEKGLGESPSLWTNNSNLLGVLRTVFENDWIKAED